MLHLPMFNTVRSFFLPSKSAGRTWCLPAPAPVQMLFRLGLTGLLLTVKKSQNKYSKFRKMGKRATSDPGPVRL